MIIHEQTQNAMEKQEILDTILAYEQELKENYQEFRDAFGHTDEATKGAWKEWNTMQELLTRLNLQNETI
jgi:hypothetical protein